MKTEPRTTNAVRGSIPSEERTDIMPDDAAAKRKQDRDLDPNLLRKRDLIDHITGTTDLNGKQARAAIEATFDFLTAGLKAEKTIHLPPFGKFSMRTAKAGTPQERLVPRLVLAREGSGGGGGKGKSAKQAIAEDDDYR